MGDVEIAFLLAQAEGADRESVQPVNDSPLVVYFPTRIETHLGFLVQGPYRTTPTRDNVLRDDPWNQHVVEETATLLVEALRWLRDQDLLDTTTLECLPIDAPGGSEGERFGPLYERTRAALASEPLLPRFGGGFSSASDAKLARTQELRELFAPSQLASIYGHDGELHWLSADITQDRTPELRRYLMRELDVAEVTPETILSRLDKPFLEAQPDRWIRELYEYLHGRQALRQRVGAMPLLRLEDGSHVTARSSGQPQAFLPSTIETGFPTVRRAVCDTDAAREFLVSLGLTVPDPVDDVVRNVLPKYRSGEVEVGTAEYAADIRRILTAFHTDSKAQREKLISALRRSAFVAAVDAGVKAKRFSRPSDVYMATERLRSLFEGVPGILLIDDSVLPWAGRRRVICSKPLESADRYAPSP